MTKNNQQAEDIDWNLTTWEGVRQEQLKYWSKLSLEEIILAQEEMREISEKLHAATNSGGFHKSKI